MSDESQAPPPDFNSQIQPNDSTDIAGWNSPPDPARIPFMYRQGISPVLFVALCLGIVFVTYQVIGGGLELLIFGFDLSPVHTAGFRILTGLSQIAFILVPTLILVRGVTFTPSAYLRLKAPRALAVLPALVGVFSLQQVLQIIQSFIDRIPLPDKLEKFIAPFKEIIMQAYQMLVASNSVRELILVVLVVAVVPAICEEMLFRGLVQRTLENSLGVWKGVIITGILFGAYHLDPFAFVPLASLGIYLGFLAMRAESLWMSASAHFFNNFVATLAVFFHLDDNAVATGNPDTMTGSQIAVTFLLFSLIFAASTFIFLQLTKPQRPQELQTPA